MSAQIKHFPLGTTALEEAVRAGQAGREFATALANVVDGMEAATKTLVANEGGAALAAAVTEFDEAQNHAAEQLRVAAKQIREEADAATKAPRRPKNSANSTDA